MTRILFATDIHLRATKPVSRLDPDYLGTLLDKLEQIRVMSENVDLVLLGGDIFDRPDVPHSVVIRASKIFRSFKTPVYTIIGNHDVSGYAGSTLGTSALGVLLESGALKKLSILHLDGCSLYAMHAFDKNEWTVPEGPNLKILVAHKMITPLPIPGAECITTKFVADRTNADVVISGDMHTSHHQWTGGKLFINPGSLARQSIADRERAVQVAVVTIEDGSVFAEMETLEGQPAEMLFDLNSYSQRMAQESHTKDFAKTYVEAIVSVSAESHKIGERLLEFLEKNGVGDKAREKYLKFLDRAQEEVLEETVE